jgi:hypothetical protein
MFHVINADVDRRRHDWEAPATTEPSPALVVSIAAVPQVTAGHEPMSSPALAVAVHRPGSFARR